MARIDFSTFSDDPPHNRKASVVGGIFAALGLLVVAWTLVHLATQPWDLADTGVQTWGRGGERNRIVGDVYVIVVDKQSHVCMRGRSQFPAREAPVLYDPADPSRCRAADAMDGPSELELSRLVVGFMLLLIGAAWLLAYFAEPREPWERENPRGLLRPKVMWLARILLGASVVLGLPGLLALHAASRGAAPPERETPKKDAAPERKTGELPVVPANEIAIEEATVTEVDGKEWPRARPKLRTLPVEGPFVWIGDPDPIGSRLVVSTGPRYHGRGSAHHLVDVAAGRVLARFDDEGLTSASAGVVVTKRDGERVIVHADDGTVVTPEIALPKGTPPDRVRIVASEIDAHVWVFAEANGVVYHGQWTDPRSPAIALSERLPFWPAHASGATGIEVWDPERANEGCWRYRFPGATCLADAPPASTEGSRPSLEHPWVIDGFPARAVDRESGRRQRLVPDCDGIELARLHFPARVFSVCLEGSGAPRFGVWSPAATWTFADVFDPSAIEVGMQREPVTTVERHTGRDAPHERWIDLERGRRVRTPPVRVPVFGGSFGFARKVIVQRVDDPGLWLLDLEAATLERIAKDDGCEHALVLLAQRGHRAVLACTSSPLESDAGRLRGSVWTEVYDFARRTRWRTDAAFEADVADDGTVAGVTRSRPARLVVIETP